MPLTLYFKIVKMVNFMLCKFYHNKKVNYEKMPYQVNHVHCFQVQFLIKVQISFQILGTEFYLKVQVRE